MNIVTHINLDDSHKCKATPVKYKSYIAYDFTHICHLGDEETKTLGKRSRSWG